MSVSIRKKEEHMCEQCEGDFDNLVTRQGFCQTFFVDFVCEACFEELEGCTFDQYGNGEEHGE